VNDLHHQRQHARRWWTLAVLCLSMFLVVITNSSLYLALPSLSRQLHASQSELQWIVDAYALVFGSLLLVCGSLSDRFGRKGTLQIGLVIFAASSLLSVLCDTTSQLIAVRAVMGVGAALIMPSTLSILANVFSGPERATAIGIWAGTAGIAGVVGPVLAGVLLDHFWWGSVFIAGVVIAALTFAIGAFVVPKSRDPHPRALDPVAFVLSSAGLTGVLFGIIEAPERGWLDRVTITALAGGALLLFAFALWELRNPAPMLELRLFRRRGFSVGAITITVTYLSIFGFQFTAIQYLQSVKGYSALRGGFGVLPISATIALVAPRTGQLARRFDPRQLVACGLWLMAVAYFGIIFVGPDTHYAYMALFLFVLGAGIAIVIAPSTTAIMESVPPANAGMGSAMNDITREMGVALGIAIMGTIHALGYRARLDGVVSGLSDTQREQARSAISAAHRVGDEIGGASGQQFSAAADRAFTYGMRWSSITLVVLVSLAATLNRLTTRARVTAVATIQP
jgi:EmrB/QacA subfamily drug resistance transporter